MIDVLDRRQVAVRYLLEDSAESQPDRECVTFEDGSAWTCAQALAQASAAAHELARAGVRQGSAVGAAVPNGPAFLRAWWGAAMLGAAVVPFNTAYRGPLLRRLTALSSPVVIVSASDFRSHLASLAQDVGAVVLDEADIIGSDPKPPRIDRPIEPWDAFSLALTSGSTGPSKLVRVTHAQGMFAGQVPFVHYGLTGHDTYLADTPMVHIGTQYFALGALRFGARIAVRERPALDRYWEVAREVGATASALYSTMLNYLAAQAPRPTEREHDLRVIVAVPLPPDPAAFRERFGLERLVVGYGSTELGTPIAASVASPVLAGETGRLRPGYEARLVDEHDRPVAPGEAGELIVRSTTPWTIMTEYVHDPVATASAWRNGWFHTGDLLRCDDEGRYFFVDRIKDAIRRRGQNISSFEVETVVRAFPGVADTAVVAYPSEAGEGDEVKAWVSVDPDAALDFAGLLHFCVDHLAHYMVPRYFEVIDDFPRTPSAKIKKQELRELGNSERTWDRVAHGLEVTRRGVATAG